jgi:hypothetical protein
MSYVGYDWFPVEVESVPVFTLHEQPFRNIETTFPKYFTVLTPLTVTFTYIKLSNFKCDIVITIPIRGLLLLPSGRNNDLSVLPFIVRFGIITPITVAHHAIINLEPIGLRHVNSAPIHPSVFLLVGWKKICMNGYSK